MVELVRDVIGEDGKGKTWDGYEVEIFAGAQTGKPVICVRPPAGRAAYSRADTFEAALREAQRLVDDERLARQTRTSGV